MPSIEEAYCIDIYGRNDVGAETRIERKRWSHTKQPARIVQFRFTSIRGDAYELHVPSEYLRGFHRSLYDPDIHLYNLLDYLDNFSAYEKNPDYEGKKLRIPVQFEIRPSEFLFEHNRSSYRVSFFPLHKRKRRSEIRKAYRRAAERPDPNLPADHENNRTTKRISIQLDLKVLKKLDTAQKTTGFSRTELIGRCLISSFESGSGDISPQTGLPGHTKLTQVRFEPDVVLHLKELAQRLEISITDYVTSAVILYLDGVQSPDVAAISRI